MTSTESIPGRTWRRLKAPVKGALSHRPVHDVMTWGSRFLPPAQAARLPAPAALKEVRAQMAGTSFVMERPARCILAKELYWGAGRRPDPVDQTALDVFAALAEDASTVFDIGSYTGIFSLLSASVNDTVEVHAFEVIPEVFLAAWSNVLRNNLAGRVTVHLRAVGAGEPLTVVRGDGGSALPDFLSTETALDATTGVRVPGLLLDDLLPYALPGHLLMKMDIEGGEPAALAGGEDLLDAAHPDILCEVLPATPTDAMQELLSRHGYRFFAVEAGALRQGEHITGRKHLRDWLFTTRSVENLRATLPPTVQVHTS